MSRQSFSQLAVCSWSGAPASPGQLIERLQGMGLKRVQLALDPLLDNELWKETPELLKEAAVSVVSGMFGTPLEDYSTPASIRATGGIVPDAAYERVSGRISAYTKLLDVFGTDLVSFHAGFIPHDRNAPLRKILLSRLGKLADAFAASGKKLLLETGQEEAETLLELLKELERPNLRVNFDPGNLLLYSMGDPLEALELLLPWIEQIHIKDALPSGDRERWGVEMPAGQGQVDWRRFMAILDEADYRGNLVIERECGDNPVGEIRAATDFLLDSGAISR